MSEQEKRMRGKVVREVGVRCYQAYTDNVWTNIGRTTEVQQCQALRPPRHVTGYVRLAPYTNKGLTETDSKTSIFVVLQGEVGVEINDNKFKTTKGDSFVVPSNANYNIVNTSQDTAELFVIQYKNQEDKLFPPEF